MYSTKPHTTYTRQVLIISAGVDILNISRFGVFIRKFANSQAPVRNTLYDSQLSELFEKSQYVEDKLVSGGEALEGEGSFLSTAGNVNAYK